MAVSDRSGRGSIWGAVLLLFALLMIVGAGVAFADDGSVGAEDPAADGGAAVERPGSQPEELPAERTATSMTLQLPDGSREARIYGTPINYLDAEGNWKPIEEGLEEADDGTVFSGRNNFALSLPEELDDDPVEIATGGMWLKSQYVGPETEAVNLDDSVATYEAADGGVGFGFRGLATGVKEDITIDDRSQPNRYAFVLTAASGLKPHVDPEGAIEFQRADGETVFSLPAPVMFDSAPSPAESHDVSYQLEPTDKAGEWRLVVAADRGWLDDPDRVWPVVIDPTFTVSSPKLDCTIGAVKSELQAGQPGWHSCGASGAQTLVAEMFPQKNEAGDRWSRILLRFATEAIPAAATVTSATFGIHGIDPVEHTAGIELRQVTKPWTEAANWLQFNGPANPWTAAGGDYSQSLGELLTSVRGADAGWWTFPLKTSVVQEEVTKNAPLSFIAKLLDDGSRECGTTSCTQRVARFDSSASFDSGNRPYLSIVYEIKAPIVTTKDASSIGETSATLNGGVYPNGKSTTYKFEYGTTTAYGKATTTKSFPGTAVVELPTSEALTGLLAKTLYHFRVSATNASGTSYGADKTFTTGKSPPVVAGETAEMNIGGAKLKATINPFGQETRYVFQYGLTTKYEMNRLEWEMPEAYWGFLGGYTTPKPIERSLSNLDSGVAYHFRVVAKNATGTTYSPDKIFYTSSTPQTTITSRHPSYTSHEMSSISFASNEPGSTFKCAFDEGEMAKPTKPCTSPFKVPANLPNGWHYFNVAAINSAGVEDATPVRYQFNPDIPSTTPRGGLVYPEAGTKTASHYTLKANWTGDEVASYEFQVQLPSWKEFRTIPAECVTNGAGQTISWPIVPPGKEELFPGQGENFYLKVRGCQPFVAAGYPEKVKFRAVFDARPYLQTSSAGASEPVSTEFLGQYNNSRIPTDAKQAIGPANVDLLTGTFTLSRTDVSIPVPGSETNLEFTRVYDSSVENNLPGYTFALGGWWQPSTPMEAEYEEVAWKALEERVIPARPASSEKECWDAEEEETPCAAGAPCPSEFCENWEIEEAQPEERWMELIANDGSGIAFEIDKNGAFVAPDIAKDLALVREGAERIVLGTTDGSHTTFIKNGNEYLPKEVSWQASPKSMRMVYQNPENGEPLRLVKEIAPAPAGVTCDDQTSIETPGCRTLVFDYLPTNTWATNAKWGESFKNLSTIRYFNASGNKATAETVAQYNYSEEGGQQFHLAEQWDPRLPNLKEKYTFNGGNALTSLTPPGQQPWEFSYYPYKTGYPYNRLRSVSRASLLASPTKATTTLAYEVPLSGSGAPYNLSPANVATWGQTDLPVNATAIFPPTQVPAEKPTDYTQASIVYMDADGYAVNTASPQLPGAGGPSISTSETNMKGQLVRTLTPGNRLAALAAGSESAAKSRLLDTQMTYENENMTRSVGPLHEVRNKSGATVLARAYRSIKYDVGAPAATAGTPAPHLPTSEYRSATNSSEESFDWQETQTKYNWELRKPIDIIRKTSTTTNLTTHTSYDPVTGQQAEYNLPGNPAGGDAHSTKTIYYTKEANPVPACGGHPEWAGLPCEVKPAAQPGTSGQPELLVTRYKSYSLRDKPVEIVESPGGSETNIRRTVISYDEAGRETQKSITGGGVTVLPTQNVYDAATGLPTETKFVCQESCSGFDNQALITVYDALGRIKEYKDADGNTATTTYDLMGRPQTVNDGKGTQTMVYDPLSGVPTELQDSAAGTFTATYDADGHITSQVLPNGLVSKTSYDSTGAPTHRAYLKTSGCLAECTWLYFNQDYSVFGQVVSQSSTLSNQVYSYDMVGRLTQVRDAPRGGPCTTRTYSYDADSNRTALVTRSPGAGGACDTTSAGTTQNYSYDAGDRLLGTGLTYDNYGRITSLPSGYAGGGGALTTSYFSNNMVATQTQDGVTNTLQLDSSGRQRQRLQAGGLTGTEVWHFAGGTDSPAWTQFGSKWSRNIAGIGGELAAVQDSASGTLLQLTNLHGDVVATASLSTTATKPVSTFESDEFGVPKQATTPQFGWLGGKTRRTEFSSGVIQMGVRSYIPTLGRFLSPDPIRGGSANAYDYANQDPVNGSDLTGEAVVNDYYWTFTQPVALTNFMGDVIWVTPTFNVSLQGPGVWARSYLWAGKGNGVSVLGTCSEEVKRFPDNSCGERRLGTRGAWRRWKLRESHRYHITFYIDVWKGPVHWIGEVKSDSFVCKRNKCRFP